MPSLLLSLALIPLLWNIVAAQEKLRTVNDVVIHLMAGPETLNLITAADASAQEIQGLIYETLTMTDPYTLEQIPWIASLPTISSDRLSYDFTLRKDAKFSDGRPVTGEDFIFFLKAIKNPHIAEAVPLRRYYRKVERLELVDGDPYRLRAVLSEPYFLGDILIGGLYAFPKHIWDPSGLSDRITFRELNEDDPDGNPAITQIADSIGDLNKGFTKRYLIGSGPYVFDRLRDERQTIVLARNRNYWNTGNNYDEASPERIIYSVMYDTREAIEALKRGDIDFIPMIEKSLFQKEREGLKDPDLNVAIYDFPAYSYIGYNQDNPLFQDRLVRKALSYAIDREAIIDDIYFGMARPIQSPIFYKRPEADTTLAVINYDLEEARKLLAQAGWKDSNGDGTLDKRIDGRRIDFRFKIMINSGNRRREHMATIIADALKQLRIDADVASLEWAAVLDRMRTGNYDAAIAGWAMTSTESDLYQIWHSESAGMDGSNYIHYHNPEVDRLIERIRGEFDFNKRKALYRQVQRIIHDDQPYTFLVAEQQTAAYSNRLRNVHFFLPRPCYNPASWRVQ